MLDWLTTPPGDTLAIPVGSMARRIASALILGVMVAGLCRWARRGESVSPSFLRTLILLAALIAMATQIIGNNVARAFSLVGALSVVRFRTVVKDSQDTAFVILAVITGMAAGADNLPVALVGLGVLALAAVLIWPPIRRGPWQSLDAVLTLRVKATGEPQARVEAALAQATNRVDLTAASTAKQGSCFDLTYRFRLRPRTTPTALVAELNALPGVEDVELKRGD